MVSPEGSPPLLSWEKILPKLVNGVKCGLVWQFKKVSQLFSTSKHPEDDDMLEGWTPAVANSGEGGHYAVSSKVCLRLTTWKNWQWNEKCLMPARQSKCLSVCASVCVRELWGPCLFCSRHRQAWTPPYLYPTLWDGDDFIRHFSITSKAFINLHCGFTHQNPQLN